ncbi:hypothetical protein B0H19DRAFT_1256550 [Mycena capillaripes]|nr:hypothetical protein B0H19DRAFT_1256550 [Mycena capillaripes]
MPLIVHAVSGQNGKSFAVFDINTEHEQDTERMNTALKGKRTWVDKAGTIWKNRNGRVAINKYRPDLANNNGEYVNLMANWLVEQVSGGFYTDEGLINGFESSVFLYHPDISESSLFVVPTSQLSNSMSMLRRWLQAHPIWSGFSPHYSYLKEIPNRDVHICFRTPRALAVFPAFDFLPTEMHLTQASKITFLLGIWSLFLTIVVAPSVNSCLPIERTTAVQKATPAAFPSPAAFHPPSSSHSG